MKNISQIVPINEFLEYLNKGKVVKSGSDMSASFDYYNQKAQKIMDKLNNNYHEPAKIREIFSELINQKVDESFKLFPPFYTDCGLNIHIGKNVFINSDCKFQDQGGIYIDDGCLIGHNVVFATLNHGLKVEDRGNLIPSPIHVGKNVWIGSNSTILPGVTIGSGSVIAAGSVVNKDVGKNVVVGGVPAKFIKKIE